MNPKRKKKLQGLKWIKTTSTEVHSCIYAIHLCLVAETVNQLSLQYFFIRILNIAPSYTLVIFIIVSSSINT